MPVFVAVLTPQERRGLKAKISEALYVSYSPQSWSTGVCVAGDTFESPCLKTGDTLSL